MGLKFEHFCELLNLTLLLLTSAFPVVYHHGRHATGGHYTVDVLRQDGSSWIHIDDTIFNSITPEQVYMSENSRGQTTASSWAQKGHDGLAYLLFYQWESQEEILKNATSTPNLNGSSLSGPPTWTSSTFNLNPMSSSWTSNPISSVSPFSSNNFDKLIGDEVPFISQNSKRSSNNHSSTNPHSNGKKSAQEKSNKQGSIKTVSSSSPRSSNTSISQISQTSTPVKRTVPGAAPTPTTTGKKGKKTQSVPGSAPK